MIGDGLVVGVGVDPPDHVESDDERDRRFAPGNDQVWGPGNWVRCPTCPHDSLGREVYHHRDAHR